MQRSGSLVLGAALAVMGLGIAALAVHRVDAVDGPTATATVTDLRVVADRTGGGRHEVRYLLGVDGATYSPGDGSGRTEQFVAIDEVEWAELSVGGPIEITYDEEDPADSRPVVAGPGGGLGSGVALGAIVVAVGMVVVLRARPGAPAPGSEQVGLDERERPMRSTPARTSTASSAAATPTRSSPDTLEAATPTNPATSR